MTKLAFRSPTLDAERLAMTRPHFVNGKNVRMVQRGDGLRAVVGHPGVVPVTPHLMRDARRRQGRQGRGGRTAHGAQP